MESDGTRADPLPSPPRRKVLRAGVRIVAEQFAPYSDEPDELIIYTASGFRFDLTSLSGRSFGRSVALHEAMQKFTNRTGAATDHAADAMIQSMKGFRTLAQYVDEVNWTSPFPAAREPQDRQPKGKVKGPKQVEPDYVKLTRHRRRR